MSPSIVGNSSSSVTTNTNVLNSGAVVNASSDGGLPQAQGDSMFSNGIHTLFNNMNMLSEQASDKYKMLQEKANLSRDAHSMANQLDEVIGGVSVSGQDATAEIPKEALDFMKKMHIPVDGLSVEDFLKKNGTNLKKGQLQAVKNALETESNRASDFVSQSQLQLQGLLQKYNVTVSLINAMQTLLAEMNKTIAQNIR
ncbi:secretion protein EspA [Parashewanella spongiae]|uniref:Secretion protein EspA n=1 Tax=Parashewanella spongiae TaxID=342950 RepID=A0A3A6U0R8_9GAMM|nr:secretion protein EspA [Parashewanella spongiae]MCL1076965.1 secretion protein EspA [Parashewanella spongiae]RJY18919.1 secretion protein EspA [Parashewanella spongiae]